MGSGLNCVHLIGNLGADPELRFTNAGKAVLNLRLAINETYMGKDNVRHKRVEWVSVTVWGKSAEGLNKVLVKGSSIFVDGQLRTSSYDDQQGTKRWKTEVVAHNVVLTGGRRAEDHDRDEDEGDAPRGNRPATDGVPGGGYRAAPGRDHGTSPAAAPASTEDDFEYANTGNDDDLPF